MNARQDGRQGHWYDPTALAEPENFPEPKPTYVKNSTGAAVSNAVVSPSREIPLTKGLVAIIDEDDAGLVGQYKWYALDSTDVVYAVAYAAWHDAILMHRLVMDAPAGLQVHHVNGNGLDNRRCNLRIVTSSQNQAARRSGRQGTSPYRGVCWHKEKQRWHARIRVDQRWHHLGYFRDESAAAAAYDEAAAKHFGEFAALNFPAVTS